MRAIRTTSSPLPGSAALAARGLTAIVVILCSIGLLSTPLGEYDDSLLLVGARLIRAGELPYLDFYTHYGPFGYTLLGFLTRLIQSPALALRIVEIGLLAGVAILAHLTMRRAAADPEHSEAAVPIVAVGLSAAALFPSYLALALVVAALAFFVSSRRSSGEVGRFLLSGTGGIALGLASLIRPAFAIYAGGALLLTEMCLVRFRSPVEWRRQTGLALFFASAAATATLLWVTLYREIPLQTAFDAAVLRPAELTAGGARYLEPDFLRGHPLTAVAAGAAIAGLNLIWAFATPSHRTKTRAVICMVGAGSLPFLLRYGLGPSEPLSSLGLLLFPLPVLLAFSERQVLRENADLASAAAFGISAAAFGHYFWSRADAPHLLPSLVLASCGAALVWRRFRWLGRLAVVSLFLASYHVAARNWHLPLLPIVRLFTVDTADSARTPGFGYTRIPLDAARAVLLADQNADPRSRFVAVASSHVFSQGSPVVLFLISTRLPYTKWFQYDPGLQSSARIQKEMERELLASGSLTAVVWRAERFRYDQRRMVRGAKSSLDDLIRRLYPRTIGRFGDYEVRARAP